jgi:hypothetical protein
MTNAHVIMGLNLEADNVPIARMEEQQLAAGLGRRIAELEIGNEPELYAYVPWYYLLHGKPRPWSSPARACPCWPASRPTPSKDYMSGFTRFRRALPSGAPIAGPSTGNYHWLSMLPRFLAAAPGCRWSRSTATA